MFCFLKSKVYTFMFTIVYLFLVAVPIGAMEKNEAKNEKDEKKIIIDDKKEMQNKEEKEQIINEIKKEKEKVIDEEDKNEKKIEDWIEIEKKDLKKNKDEKYATAKVIKLFDKYLERFCGFKNEILKIRKTNIELKQEDILENEEDINEVNKHATYGIEFDKGYSDLKVPLALLKYIFFDKNKTGRQFFFKKTKATKEEFTREIAIEDVKFDESSQLSEFKVKIKDSYGAKKDVVLEVPKYYPNVGERSVGGRSYFVSVFTIKIDNVLDKKITDERGFAKYKSSIKQIIVSKYSVDANGVKTYITKRDDIDKKNNVTSMKKIEIVQPAKDKEESVKEKITTTEFPVRYFVLQNPRIKFLFRSSKK